MKKVVLFCMAIAITISLSSYGQSISGDNLYASRNPSPSYGARDYTIQSEVVSPPGVKKKKTGTTLTIAGCALLAGGIALVSSADELYFNYSTGSNGTHKEGDPKGGFGVLMIAGGVGMIIPGVILHAKGKKRYERYLQEQNLTLRTSGAGITLQLKL